MRVQDASLGWNQNTGMAATSADKDYVHQTIRILKENGLELEPVIGSRDCDVCADIIGEHMENIDEVRQLHPRYVVVQLGENSTLDEVASGKLRQEYQGLIEAIRARGAARVFCVSDWDEASLDDPRNASIRKAIGRYPDIRLVDITALAKHPENYGDTAIFANRDVTWHPGDLGMRRIAESLAAAILESK